MKAVIDHFKKLLLNRKNKQTEFLFKKVLQFYWIYTMFKLQTCTMLCSVLIERVRFLTLVFSLAAPLFISASRISDSLELLLDLHSSERHESLLTSNFRGRKSIVFRQTGRRSCASGVEIEVIRPMIF